jgi:membrane fusion protein (multidrug efflux system)
MPVEVSDVRPQVVRDQFRALGSIESDDIIQVVSELNATVTRLPFVEGSPVGAGDLIAQLDDRAIRAEAERADAQRDQARANLDRAQALFDQRAVPQQGLDDARTAFKVAEANASLARTRLDKTRIRAPFAGVIGTRRVSVGAYLREGDVITELARVDEMKVTFSAPERFLSALRPGVAVEVTTPALPGEGYRGRLSVVNPIVDPQSRTVELVARIPNPGRRLRPGLSANVAVTFAERQKALAVSDEAVFAEGDQSFVYVVQPDSTVAKTPVRLGTRDSMRVEIVAGLEPGQRVVRAGHQKLFPGAKVMPVPEGMMGAMMGGGPPGRGAAGGPRGGPADGGDTSAAGAGGGRGGARRPGR